MDTPNDTKKYSDNVSVANRTKQVSYFVQQHDKFTMLMEILKNQDNKQILVLVKSKKTADMLMDFLNKKELHSLAIHGNHRTVQIEEAQKAFNAKKVTILITTDRILEKLILENLQTVISYDLPLEADDYFKRLILVDEVGESISFVNQEDEAILEIIEYMMKSKIDEKKVENFQHTTAPEKIKKDKSKKPSHKKVAKRAKKKAEKESTSPKSE